MRETLGFPRSRPDRDRHAQVVTVVRAAIGDEAFATAVAQGKTMTLHDAVEYALAGAGVERSDHAGTEIGTAARTEDPLTAREREVAALIARGLTNREIATKLVISERTADACVQHILDKLGFGSTRTDRGVGGPARAARGRFRLTPTRSA